MYPTFQAFRPHFDALANVAYYKIVPKPSSKLVHSLHTAYRVGVWVLILTYNLEHIIRVVQDSDNTEQIVESLFLLLTTLNGLNKMVVFNARSWRIDRIIATLQGPLFAARNAFDEEVMKANARVMARLLMLDHGSIYVACAFFAVYPVVYKLMGEDSSLTGYFPFDTSGWIGFSLGLAFNSFTLTVIAYGAANFDCTTVAFYAQAKTQLQMLRNSLEHLVDPVGGSKTEIPSRDYKDIEDPEFALLLKKRLVRCVEHYKLVVWFAKEVESIFGEALALQIFMSAWIICMTLYKISGEEFQLTKIFGAHAKLQSDAIIRERPTKTELFVSSSDMTKLEKLSLLSLEFVSMLMYLGVMLMQLFMYCFYGTQLTYESELISTSVYRSEWLSLSPRFRSLLLVVMARAARPVEPSIAHVIPMSLDTFIAVLRSSYTLFTFLKET